MRFLKQNRFEIIVISILGFLYIATFSYCMIELPWQTWIDQIPLADKLYSGTLSVTDLVTTYGEHGMLGTNLLFLLNIRVLHLSTLLDVYVNDLNVIIIACACVISMKKSFQTAQQIGRSSYRVAVVLVCFFAFNILQGSSGGMDTQVRLGFLFSILEIIYAEKTIRAKDDRRGTIVVNIVFLVCAINVFGTAYSFATVFVICMWILVRFIRSKKIHKIELVISIACILASLLYLFEYHLIGKGSVDSSVFDALKSLIMEPREVFLSLVGYCGSFVLGYASIAEGALTDGTYLLIGCIMLLVMAVAIIEFYIQKMYMESNLPILLIAYSMSVWLFVLIGRYDAGHGMWKWFTNVWYFVHTKVAMIGITWILCKALGHRSKRSKTITVLCLISLLIFGIRGTTLGLKRIPYEKQYYMAMQPYLFAENIEELPIDAQGDTPLIHNPEMTIQAINTLKRYHLSVYRYYGAYEKMNEILKKD